ncbi:TetR/AcrR family transcriptional regulator [Mycolicibacterium sp. P9-64]|uniref:TetR/AcrR family transcriptional regulator n=1 Tax=Mycolicibacterium sp. P9-64 TaxID=2024612 RepID=UPI0011ED5C72|nr:TetR/AcrR family transcriptional regulator [Mycolicibacterium sp. P9-64]KAA0081218.1 TetR/AcrR family transcriptional regulator [Mycolicibacterium sp. P9-64]
MTAGPAERPAARPARGTRPVNRRQLIIDAATELFSRKGYAGVSMGDVAEAVAIGPSALYRHFRGKQELLATVVTDALATLDAALAKAEDEHPPDAVHALATAVLAHRTVGVLWQREARQLAPDDRAAIRSAVNDIGRRFAAYIQVRRPALSDGQALLLAWSGLAVATSVSYHSLTLPEPAFTTLLGELITTAIDAPIPRFESASARDARPPALRSQSRRELILTEATKLFAANGFGGVSTDDIGASVGITGPSVYNHFPAKSDILVAAMVRGDEWLRIDMSRAFAAASDPRDGLNRLLRSYCAFVIDNPHLVAVLVSEVAHLPESERHHTRASQYAYIAEWVNLLREVHPQWDAVTARIRVQAAQTVMNDIALIPSLRQGADIQSALVTIGSELLETAHR